MSQKIKLHIRERLFLFYIVPALILTSGNCAIAQEIREEQSLRIRYGLGAGYDFIKHSADFKELPGAPSCCPRYESGSGSGVNFGLFVEYPLSSVFIAGVRLGYNSMNGLLSRDEPAIVVLNGSIYNGTFTHTVDAKIGVAGIEPYLGFYPFPSLMIFAGAGAGIYSSKSYAQQEQITQPSNAGTFMGLDGADSHLRVRNQSSGALNNTTTPITAFAGISYELPLSAGKSFVLAPAIAYRKQIGDIIQSLSWSVSALSASLAFKYSPGPAKIIYERSNDVITEKIEARIVANSKNNNVENHVKNNDLKSNNNLEQYDSSKVETAVDLVSDSKNRKEIILDDKIKDSGVSVNKGIDNAEHGDAPQAENHKNPNIPINTEISAKTTLNTEDLAKTAKNSKNESAANKQEPIDSFAAAADSRQKNNSTTATAVVSSKDYKRCCRLQFIFTRLKKNATSCMNMLKSQIAGLKMEMTPEIGSSVIYQVVSDCFATPEQADELILHKRKIIIKVQKKLNIQEAPRILCGDTK